MNRTISNGLYGTGHDRERSAQPYTSSLKQIQADVAELKQIRREMRGGFASVKSHMTGLIGDVFRTGAEYSTARTRHCD
jgi:hypothetical protein